MNVRKFRLSSICFRLRFHLFFFCLFGLSFLSFGSVLICPLWILIFYLAMHSWMHWHGLKPILFVSRDRYLETHPVHSPCHITRYTVWVCLNRKLTLWWLFVWWSDSQQLRCHDDMNSDATHKNDKTPRIDNKSSDLKDRLTVSLHFWTI